MPKRGHKRKKTRTHVIEADNVAAGTLASQEALKIPRSLVFRRGRVESEVIELVTDLRKLMAPYTALHFKENAKDRKVTMAHYAKELAGPLGVTHLLGLSQKNESNQFLRVARTPAGPTLSFRVERFSLTKHVRATQRRPMNDNAFRHAPIVVTNNFGDSTAAPHIKLLRITFQNMFPAINVATVKLADCRRVVLFNLVRREKQQLPPEQQQEEKGHVGHKGVEEKKQGEEEQVEVRHYAIRATPVGVDRKVRRIIQANKIPNLSKLEDISSYITGKTASGAPVVNPIGAMSDSEVEDETSHVVLPQKYAGKGNCKSQKSALKLVELGPRLCLKLIKVERGLGGGDVMYHAHIQKSPKEIKEQRAKIEKEALSKKKRREEQTENVKRKLKVKEDKSEAKRRRREEREASAMSALRTSSSAPNGNRYQKVDDAGDEGNSNDDDEEEETVPMKDGISDSESDEAL